MQDFQTNNLAQIAIGEEAQVISIEGNSQISKRLMEMGIIPGVSVKVIKTAPFGCPMEIKVKGYHLALRKGEAETIQVKSKK